jgi:hypothetical protein
MKITDIEDGQIITEPGAYRMSMNWYHQQCCDGPSVSSSGLRRIWNESPHHFWMTSDLNENRLPPGDESPALALGKAAHALMLGEDNFDAMFAYVPGDAPRRPTATQIKAFERDGKWSDAAKDGAAYWSEWDAKHAGKTMITEDMVEKVRRMAASLNDNPLAKEALTSALTEVSLIWQDEATGVYLKSRIDVIPTNGADFSDLKTFAPRTKSVKRAVHQAVTDHSYDMQMAMGQMAAREVFGMDASECVLVMLQSTAPFCCVPVKLDEDALYWGRVRIRHAINTFAECMKSGEWPQPVEGILDYTLPASLGERLSEMQINGELPNIDR